MSAAINQPGPACPAGHLPRGRSRIKKLLMAFGIAFGAFILVAGVAALIICYKATRKFPLDIIDVVPPDAVAYVEFDDLAASWPSIVGFADAVRKSPRYRTAVRTDPLFRDAKLDMNIDRALEAIAEFKEKSGVDPVEAAFGYKTAVALFCDPLPAAEAPGAASGGPPGPGTRFGFAAFTFLSGLKVRIAALFAGTALSGAAPKGAEITGYDGFTGIKTGSPGGPAEIYFAVLKDLLVVSDRRSAMESVLHLASSGISGSLGARPEFRDAFGSVSDPSALLRFWVDFKAADSLFDIRKKSEVKIAKFPFVYLGRYMNGTQRGVVDLENAVSLAGTLKLDPASGTVKSRGRMAYAGGKANSFLVRTYGLEPAEPFAAAIAPPDSACAFSVRKDWKEFWDQLGYEGDADSRESFLKLNETFQDAFGRIAAGLGSDYAVFLKASPLAAAPRQGIQPPLPWICLAATSPDPTAVSREITGIFNSQIEKYAAKAPPSEIPMMKSETVADALVSFVDNIPADIRNEVSPDFMPGFYTRGNQIVVFTSLDFAKEVIAAGGRRDLLADEPGYAAARAATGDKSTMSLYADGERLFSMMTSYRVLLAEEMRPLDWKEGIRIIERTYGRNLPPDELRRHQDSYEAGVRKKQGEIAAKLAQRFENLKILKTLALSCTYVANEANRAPAGIDFALAAMFDLD